MCVRVQYRDRLSVRSRGSGYCGFRHTIRPTEFCFRSHFVFRRMVAMRFWSSIVNLEESKLEGVAPGNRVRLDIVAFGKPFLGRVVWINRATGANFALVPRNISSGEFTYVVQRVPVRILIEMDDRWPQLRAGLSVTVAIEHGPGDLDWAKGAAETIRALEATVKPSGD